MQEQLYADVLVEVPVPEPGRTFQYLVPKELHEQLQFGHRVKVPFGSRRVTGYVVGLGREQAVVKVKALLGLVEENPLFKPDQFELARWIAGYYCCDLVKALQAVIAPLLKKTAAKVTPKYYCDLDSDQLSLIQAEYSRRAPKSLAVLDKALEMPGLSKTELAGAAGASAAVVEKLASRGWLQVRDQTIWRDPYPQAGQVAAPTIELNDEQARAVREISTCLDRRKHTVFMVHGVTGSGKTEVYLRCIEQVIKAGRQVIVLAPEISLTSQLVKLFRGRMGRAVAVLHSRMSDGERFDEWERIARGEAQVVLGARSAVLAPVIDPGLIIIDEEHEWSYKQEETPRYHARAVALYRSQKCGGVLVLGSATPSLESYCRAVPGGVYKLINLEKRIEERPMPKAHILDMREETRGGNGGIFSRRLLRELELRVAKQEQAIIFLNRRGINTLVVCRECGLVLKCPNCEISLTHHTGGKVRCHYCNYTVGAPKLCPDCGSRQVAYLGTGTQRVEQELRMAIPTARILRMDADTTTRKGSHQQILDSFDQGEADILVGTQMIAKGLDLAGVTMVGVINADLTLHMPDFRAGERTFQLLAQVAGRAGRGERPGEVFIQTYTPDHYSIQTAAKHDYHAFYRQEIALRKVAGYPPYSRMARVLFAGPKEEAVRAAADKARQTLAGFAEQSDGGKIYLVGPAPAPLAKLRQAYRYHIIIWSNDFACLHRAIQHFGLSAVYTTPGKGVRISIDVDPMSMM